MSRNGFLLAKSFWRRTTTFGRFEEIASDVGLDATNLAGGSIMEDFDNDGLFDIITSTWDPDGALLYYHNNGDGTFSDHTAQAGLGGQLGGLNIVQTDYKQRWLDRCSCDARRLASEQRAGATLSSAQQRRRYVQRRNPRGEPGEPRIS